MKTILTTTILLLTGLINATISFSQTELWGTTGDGGEYGLGAVFKTNYNGLNQTVVHSFQSPFPGDYPAGDLIQATNGNFYGFTFLGGSCGYGNFFEYNLVTNDFNVLVNFDKLTGYPTLAPIQASNGKFYGLTYSETAGNSGTLFEYDLSTQAMTILSDFSGLGINCVKYGHLIEATNGKLYALVDGGSGGSGAIFEYEIATNNLSVVYNFPASGLDGFEPWGGLMQATNGFLYGMTPGGGVNYEGNLFEYDIATSTLNNKQDFSYATGNYPYGTPMQASNGLIYGLTSSGGTGGGTLFEYDPVSDVFTVRKTFDWTTGQYPNGKLCEAPNGILYGMNAGGGINSYGTLISYNPTTLVTSVEVPFDGVNGAGGDGSLMLASNGNLYCLTLGDVNSSGNTSGNLIEFNYNNSSVTPLFNFNEGPQGLSPAGALTQASNGKLYGITQYGGSDNMGTIYEIDPVSGVFALAASFDTSNGGMPNLLPYTRTELCAASNGKLYGLTYKGGINNQGSLFEFDPAAFSISKLVDFSSVVTGGNPTSRMIEASDGKLYGIAMSGGINNMGTLFSFEVASSTFTKLFDFDGTSGGGPGSALSELGAGKLYGITRGGGANNKGTIFVYDILTASLTKLSDFGATTGTGDGTLYRASNGSIYGMVTREGANSQGTIFTLDTTSNTIIKLHDLDGNNSVVSNTPGGFTEVYPGKLFAMREIAGTDFLEGDLFEFDIASNTYTRLIDFECEQGYRPLSTSLTKVNTSSSSMVWPGDINYDMKVDNVDFLWLGLAIGDSGPIRAGATTNWTGQPSAPWSNSYINTVNYKHADSNGDGNVTVSDSVAISLNYNDTHPLRNQYQNLLQSNTEIKLIANTNAIAPGSLVEFDIYLADISLPQDSIYGLAFSLNFDPALVDPSQSSLSFSPSVLGNLGTDLNSLEKYFPGSGRVEIALSRTNQVNASNLYGVIGKLSLVASPLVNILSGLVVTPSDITAITAGGQTFSMTPVSDSVIVDPALIGIDDNNTISDLSIFPNPVSSKLQLNHKHNGIVKILISDSRGSVVYQKETRDQESEIQLQGLSEGVYFIQIMTEKSVINKKIIVKHP